MPKKKKPSLFGGLLGIAERGIAGQAERMAAEEAKALGTKPKKPKKTTPTDSWGRGVRRNK